MGGGVRADAGTKKAEMPGLMELAAEKLKEVLQEVSVCVIHIPVILESGVLFF
ncbi:MAG: hypothetical protein JRJ00_04150 [Deltaproteobacteria bacterium]|jgi:hypothetical protein|nr:hypothetical protein [Deltaproteobacteria bacterium]